MRSRSSMGAAVIVASVALCASLHAQPANAPEVLPQIKVTANRIAKKPQRRPRMPAANVAKPPPVAPTAPQPDAITAEVDGTPPLKQKYQLPQTTASTTATRIEQTVNAVDTEDAIKYLPSLLLRKRNYGDNQVVLATRTHGINASAESLVYADDIQLSALFGNNNSNATTRWGMVAPEEIQRIDFLYGPFAAMYPGNSVGGVLQITTKMPDKPQATFTQSEALQTFSLYNTKQTLPTSESAFTLGNRFNDLSVLITGNFQDSYSQPLNWVTTTAPPAGTSGTIPALSRTGTIADVVGAGGILHTDQETLKAKFALDITSWLTATYTIGLWSNDEHASVQSYLTSAAGVPTFGGVSAFASDNYSWYERHLSNALSLKTDTRGNFDWDISASRYDYLEDIQRNPFAVGPGETFSTNGKIARLDGTNWTNVDAKGIWRPTGPDGAHEVSFGFHWDRYYLNNPTYATPIWNGGPDSTSSLYSDGLGATETNAFWAQDAWRFLPDYKLTFGGRWESWRAYDGFNLLTTTSASGAITSTKTVMQPDLDAQRFSPKASLSWDPNKNWDVTASFGIANRFPTVGELYQTATSGSMLIFPNPDLKPEEAFSEELAIERKFTDGKVRLSFFWENDHNALISQTNTVPGTTTTATFVTNVDATQERGIELAWDKDNVLINKLLAFGSMTYTDSETLSDPTFVSTIGGTTADGKRVPYIPTWRVTVGGTYHPDDAWSFTVAGRYQSKIFATLDNSDVVGNVYQAFDPFFVVDVRALYKVSDHGSISFGVDNLNNDKYFLFHSFPQRTYVLQGKLTF